ncbi:MAG TPA: NAD(P)/FAD-dependent oxidoreductase, partial [Geobacteraceae bacterium]
PIRSILARYRNVRVLLDEARSVDLAGQRVITAAGQLPFDYLIMACGAQHAYFGHEEWESLAPGMKTLEQATEIRRRVLTAFEEAEKSSDPVRRQQLLTFVVVGGGPTGVELAGAIAEMSRYTLANDFRAIDPRMSRVILVEGLPRILGAFVEHLSASASASLQELGVQVRTSAMVTGITVDGVSLGDEFIPAATVIWAAGVKAASLGDTLGVPQDQQGRVYVTPELSVAGHPELFVVGDQAHCRDEAGRPLPGLAPVALQQGRTAARNILRDLAGEPRQPYHYLDKGQMATIGRSKAVGQFRAMTFTGLFAWLTWLLVHIYYLTGFANRLFVVLHWGWSYLTFKRGARLITRRDWQLYSGRP